MPTTGEFGPRGGNGDLENHTKLATRFGASFTNARDARYTPLSDSTSNNTQARLSDGVNLYERGTLAEGVTVSRSNYQMGSIDMGIKYRGFFFQTQGYIRYYSKFAANGPLPINSITDKLVMVDASYMVIPYTLCYYVSGSYYFDQFKRNPWEMSSELQLLSNAFKKLEIDSAFYLYT
ncbi:MAG: hypothetical protein M3R36_17190 [Bacteroidota bacterium]|nr:hypothetical protein [Bacteroidota bacterium]